MAVSWQTHGIVSRTAAAATTSAATAAAAMAATATAAVATAAAATAALAVGIRITYGSVHITHGSLNGVSVQFHGRFTHDILS